MDSNDCHDLTMLSVNISNIAVITVKNVDYHYIIHNISKSDAINLLIFFLNFFCLVYIKRLILWPPISL